MNRVHAITKGLNIPIPGVAVEELEVLPTPSQVALKPTDFRGIAPRLLVQSGERVAVGAPLVEDKNDSRVILTAPGGGTVSQIKRGHRRRLEEIVIDLDSDNEEGVAFHAYSKSEIDAGLDREVVVNQLLESGLWPLIKQRPFARIANPDNQPQAIYVSAIDSEPLAANPCFLIKPWQDAFKTGMRLLATLTSGKLYLCVPPQPESGLECCTISREAEIHQFRGPHPVGSVGTHIHCIEPIRPGNVVWYLRAIDVVQIGRLFLEGRYPLERTFAVAGPGCPSPRYFTARQGIPLDHVLRKAGVGSPVRVIAGSVLTGKEVQGNGFLGFYDYTLTVLPTLKGRRLLGWLNPGLSQHSASKTFASSWLPLHNLKFDTGLHGSPRAFVPIGSYEAVTPLDIEPVFLFKSIIYDDLPQAEKLGLLECAEEDVALMSYVCHSKIDFCSLLRTALDKYEKEG